MKNLFGVFAVLLIFSCSVSEDNEYTKDSGFVDINGTKLFYETMGEGEPIIFVHGGPGMNHEYFLPQMAPLADQYKLIFYDQRACGDSDVEVDTLSMTMAQFVDDLDAVRAHFGIEKMVLAGHSWGGLLAMWYAKTYPERLEKLILINSIGASREYTQEAQRILMDRYSEEDIELQNELVSSEAFRNGEPEAFLKVFRLSFKPTFYKSELLDELSLSLPEDPQKNQNLLRHLYPDLMNYDLHEELSKVDVPVLIFHGNFDGTPVISSVRLEEAFPRARLVEVPECGHWTFIEQPGLFRKDLDRFMEE